MSWEIFWHFFSQKSTIFLLLFQVSIALLIFCSVHMQLFLVETVKLAPKRDQVSACLTTPIKIIQKRYKSMKDAATIVMSSPTLRGISLVSFFFELGKSGINCVLMVCFLLVCHSNKQIDGCMLQFPLGTIL
ncbi:uncharacterized protein LOC115985276 [Quercus lobata]|uniref:uncharacterized protein LOC115985276 n=1 Tax=Quercus lobata TaxID=97700 RepID=UPI0012457936|nr:uncharacterized protein LOC115985276 [Quercus lobata]